MNSRQKEKGEITASQDASADSGKRSWACRRVGRVGGLRVKG